MALLLAALLAVAPLSGCAKKSSADQKSTAAPSMAPSKPAYTPPTPTQPATTAAPQPLRAGEPAPAGGMYYENYGTNPMVNPSTQPTTTFAIDVDTASYTLVRNYINRGQLPPADAVRVEEFINYFPQNYPNPSQAVGLYVEGGKSPFRAGTSLVQIGLKAREVGRAERKPAVLTFVIDISGSMNMENRLGLVKQSLGILLDQLSGDDQVGIVVYGSQGRVLLEHTADKDRIRDAIGRLSPEGSTNAEEGLRLGYELASRAFLKGGTNRVILCSDGVANTGLTRPDDLLRSIEDWRGRGITLTTVGFGMGNFNDVLMEQLADKGDGMYAYVDQLPEARRIFQQQLMATLELVARDAKVQVTFDPAQVVAYRLVGYENRGMANENFRNDGVDGGEMGAGHTVTALYEVTLRGNGSQLGQVSVRYKDAATGEVVEQAAPILRSTATAAPSARVRWTASVAEFAGLLRGSPWAAESRMDAVRELAWDAARDLDMPTAHKEALELIDRAARLRGGR
jgi:Ca-activated chloride channel family protein